MGLSPHFYNGYIYSNSSVSFTGLKNPITFCNTQQRQPPQSFGFKLILLPTNGGTRTQTLSNSIMAQTLVQLDISSVAERAYSKPVQSQTLARWERKAAAAASSMTPRSAKGDSDRFIPRRDTSTHMSSVARPSSAHHDRIGVLFNATNFPPPPPPTLDAAMQQHLPGVKNDNDAFMIIRMPPAFSTV